MSARILVADDIEANRRLLEAKLRYAYFEVDTAIDGTDALEKALVREPDVILLDLMMPGMDGMETCKRLKSDSRTEHVPVVMVTALGDREDRLRCLRAGADDFLSKPVDDFQLLSRIRALTRYKLVVDELRRREASARVLRESVSARITEEESARILIIDSDTKQAQRLCRYLAEEHFPFTLQDSSGEVSGGLDLVILVLSGSEDAGLRLCSRVRSMEGLRDLPILVLADSVRKTQAVRALDLGASDILLKPIDAEELLARVRTQVRRKHYMDMLRRSLDRSVELAVTDSLTGLYNRRYFSDRLESFVQRTNRGGGPVSLLMADLDHFKQINDNYGHDVGDSVLVGFVGRLRASIRPGDVACRFGGEEFVVLMPETSLSAGMTVAERIRVALEGHPFPVGEGEELQVSMSGGVASVFPPADSADSVLRRADEALYKAKRLGRNRVMSEFSGLDLPGTSLEDASGW